MLHRNKNCPIRHTLFVASSVQSAPPVAFVIRSISFETRPRTATADLVECDAGMLPEQRWQRRCRRAMSVRLCRHISNDRTNLRQIALRLGGRHRLVTMSRRHSASRRTRSALHLKGSLTLPVGPFEKEIDPKPEARHNETLTVLRRMLRIRVSTTKRASGDEDAQSC